MVFPNQSLLSQYMRSCKNDIAAIGTGEMNAALMYAYFICYEIIIR